MALSLIYITNNPEVALIAEENGVELVMVDLETLGKEERQRGLNTVKSHHSISDITAISSVLTKSETLVRINPWNDNSPLEIERVITAGADRIMLPMWRSADEVGAFTEVVNSRAKIILLLETKEAVECLDRVLENPLIEEIHIGLNDLHLSYGMTFLFETLSNGVVEDLCKKFKENHLIYGFGGIARIGEGMLPAECIIMEHYRLGSTRAILSRSFCNVDEIGDISCIRSVFKENIYKLNEYEKSIQTKSSEDYIENKKRIDLCVEQIVNKIREKNR